MAGGRRRASCCVDGILSISRDAGRWPRGSSVSLASRQVCPAVGEIDSAEDEEHLLLLLRIRRPILSIVPRRTHASC
eukprot:SAG31_NODE_195_length_20708_cov_9.627638_6_plen_77_part_00